MPKLGDAGSNKDFAIAPEGTHAARIYRIVDKGTHTRESRFGVKEQREILFSFELVNELMDPNSDGIAQPFTIHKVFKLSAHEKSSLRKMIEGLWGKFKDDHEASVFELKQLLNCPCLVSIAHAPSGDKTYANVTSITNPLKGMQVKDAQNPMIYFSLCQEDFSQAVFDGLPKKIQDAIMSSPEWADLKGLPKTVPDSDKPVADAAWAKQTHDDEIPF